MTNYCPRYVCKQEEYYVFTFDIPVRHGVDFDTTNEAMSMVLFVITYNLNIPILHIIRHMSNNSRSRNIIIIPVVN